MTRSGRKLLIAAILTVIAHPARARTQIESPSDTIRSQLGTSYWGSIPPPNDSVTGVFENRPTPIWEEVLVWPYRVISVPFSAIRIGCGQAVAQLDRSGWVSWVSGLLGSGAGPLRPHVSIRAGGLSGVGGSLTLEHRAFLGTDNRLRLEGATTFRGNQRASLGMLFRVEPRGEFEVGVGIRDRPNARYFGLGPETDGADQAFFREETAWLALGYRHSLRRRIVFGAEAVVSRVEAGLPGADYAPALPDRFAGTLPAGYDQSSGGVSFRGTLVHDNTRGTGRPNVGGVRRFRVAVFKSIGEPESSFLTYRGELQQFVRLWFPAHVLALRSYLSWIDPIGTNWVPFQRLLTNDEPDLLRGYDDLRWRARGMAVVSAEYRWPLWVFLDPNGVGVDMYVLGDVGQVFEDFNQITPDNLTFSWGGGFRLISGRGFTGRLEYARSSEGWVLRLRGEQIFQFAKDGLLHGRSPVPLR